MPVKIEFQVVSSTGEDEDFRATELNYHGPAVRGWRSSVNCTFPQEIVLRLRVLAILHQIQILAHQYLIPQKIEICTSSRLDRDKPCNNHCDLFEYLGFITFSDNEATGFRSRELKSILIPSKKARYIKLRIHNNHVNVKNVHNQVGLVAVNILGDEMQDKTEESEVNNNGYHTAGAYPPTLTFNPDYLSPYDDLAFEMSVDEETAKIIKIVECKMLQAVFEERLDHANALNITIENLRAAGEILGVYEQEKRRAITLEDFDKAKSKKLQIDNFRQKIYTTLRLDRLLEDFDFGREYDLNSNVEKKNVLSNESSPIRNSPQRYQPNGRTTTPSEILGENHETAPLRSLRPPKRSQPLPPPLTHSQSQTFPDSHAFCHPFPAFATSSSNPQLYQYLKQTRPTISEAHREPDQKLEDSLENVKTPSSLSDSLTGDSSPPKTPEKFSPPTEPRSVKNRSVPLIPRRNARNEPARKGWKRSSSPPDDWGGRTELKTSLSEQKIRTRATNALKSSFEAYEDRMLPALRSFQGNEVVRECQMAFGQQRKSTLNEREKKQAMLPIAVFGIEMIEKFYSKSFNDKEEGLKQLQQELKRANENDETKPPSYNKLARAAIFLLHRGLRDTVYSVYKLAAETVRLFFAEFVPQRVSLSEVARSVEKLLPELLTKSGDVTPRIHNMAAHTLLSMADCEEVRRLHIIPAHLSRPLTSSIHPRLALSRLEMVEQLILNYGISKDKKSGLTCRTLAEFGSSGLHHPAEAVRKVSERILIHVYKVNPRIVRKQLPPDDNVTRRNLLYRQLFQEFDFMDMERKLSEQTIDDSMTSFERNPPSTLPTQHPEIHKNKLKTAYSLGNENSVDQVSHKSTVDFNADVHTDHVKAFLSQNAYKGRNYVEKPPLRRPPQDRFKKRDQEAVHKNPEGYSEEGEAAVKFPSLTDSIKTTKARISLEKKSSPKGNPAGFDSRKLQSGGSSLSKSLTRKANGRDNAYSGIPVPTFGTSRKLLVTSSKRLENQGQDKPPKSYKPKEEFLQTKIPHRTIKIRMFDLDEPAKPELRPADAPKKGNEKDEKWSKEAEVEESIKFSESMLASIRENEFTMSGLFNEGDRKEEKLKTCIFCLSSNQWANEESLNKHYLKECLMLTTCEYCMEVTEISGLTNHLLDDCKWKNIFQRCTHCQEAILRDLYSKHECTASGGKMHKLRCPFCHKDIGQGESSWRKHLMGKDTCPNHPRQK